jgi:hypothetical protein
MRILECASVIAITQLGPYQPRRSQFILPTPGVKRDFLAACRGLGCTPKAATPVAFRHCTDGGFNLCRMGNVLSGENRAQVAALGRLDWPLRRMEEAAVEHRKTAGANLLLAGIAIRQPGNWGGPSLSRAITLNIGPLSLKGACRSKPANGVATTPATNAENGKQNPPLFQVSAVADMEARTKAFNRPE